jgi:hypothetical protein
MKVEVRPPKDESLQSQLASLYLTFKDADGQTLFDLGRIKWLFPLLILPVATYIQDTASCFAPPSNPDVRSYLETVRFPSGVESISEVQKEKELCSPHCSEEKQISRERTAEGLLCGNGLQGAGANGKCKKRCLLPYNRAGREHL